MLYIKNQDLEILTGRFNPVTRGCMQISETPVPVVVKCVQNHSYRQAFVQVQNRQVLQLFEWLNSPNYRAHVLYATICFGAFKTVPLNYLDAFNSIEYRIL